MLQGAIQKIKFTFYQHEEENMETTTYIEFDGYHRADNFATLRDAQGNLIRVHWIQSHAERIIDVYGDRLVVRAR